MKNFSTAALMFALTGLCSPAWAATCEFNDQAPDSHKVVAGDTLWDIAALFLKNPWCWPKVWETNRKHIRDPHWIYPGQTVYFKRALGRLSLTEETEVTSGSSDGPGAAQLSPRIRSEPLDGRASNTPIPVLAPHLQALLGQAPVLIERMTGPALTIVGFSDQHTMAGTNDTVYVVGDPGSHSVFTVVRKPEPVIDPQSGQMLGFYARRLGNVRLLERAADSSSAHRFMTTASYLEFQKGDQLVPMMSPYLALPAPHPAPAINAQLSAMPGGSRWASQYDIVAINRGQLHGLDAGSVLAVMKRVKIGAHDAGLDQFINLPLQQTATLLVFTVGERISFALVMRASDILSVGDIVQSADAGLR